MLRIDLSTIALILALVLPGVVAKKSRRKFCPQSFESAGPATELGELVGHSLAVHVLLLACFSLFALFVGLARHHSAFAYLKAADEFDYPSWSHIHVAEAVLLVASYVCLSVAIAYLYGIASGWFRLNHPILNMLVSRPRLIHGLQQFGISALLEERPLSFELFSGEAANRKIDLIYFLDIRLRDDKGFVTGELVKYAIVKDEESHRPVVLRDAQFKLCAGDTYEPMEGDRVLVDLADALLVQVSYRDRAQALAENSNAMEPERL